MKENENSHGITLLYTGCGKGKTTAALGLLLRAWGDGFSVGCVQFLKSPEWETGEKAALQKLGIPLFTLGKGFVFPGKSQDEHRAAAFEAWETVKQMILSGTYDLLMLDEITYPLAFGWLDAAECVSWLREHKPDSMHLVLTGRDAPQELINYADTVSEVKEIKHHCHAGITAQTGIEY